jgi:hypothetical protein
MPSAAPLRRMVRLDAQQNGAQQRGMWGDMPQQMRAGRSGGVRRRCCGCARWLRAQAPISLRCAAQLLRLGLHLSYGEGGVGLERGMLPLCSSEMPRGCSACRHQAPPMRMTRRLRAFRAPPRRCRAHAFACKALPLVHAPRARVIVTLSSRQGLRFSRVPVLVRSRRDADLPACLGLQHQWSSSEGIGNSTAGGHTGLPSLDGCLRGHRSAMPLNPTSSLRTTACFSRTAFRFRIASGA